MNPVTMTFGILFRPPCNAASFSLCKALHSKSVMMMMMMMMMMMNCIYAATESLAKYDTDIIDISSVVVVPFVFSFTAVDQVYIWKLPICC